MTSLPHVHTESDLALEILNTVEDACYMLDSEFRFIFVNKKAEQLWNKRKEQLLGKCIWDEFPQAVDSESYRKHKEALIHHVPQQFQTKSPIVNVWVEVSIFPNKIGLVVHFHKIETRKKLEEALQEQSSLLQLASEAFIVLDKKNKISFWSRGAEHLYEWTAQEAIGRVGLELLQTEFPQPYASILKVLEKNGEWQGRLTHTTKSGKKVIVDSRWGMIERGKNLHYLEVNRDITQQVAIETQAQEKETDFQATFEQAAAGMAHVGLDGKWLLVNHRLAEITGYTKEELLKKTFQEITYPEDLEKDLEQMNKLISGEITTYSMEKRYMKKNNGLVWVNLTVSLVRNYDNTPRYLISVIEDITRLKQAEEQKDEFMNIASHELKTPVTSLKAYAQVLERRFKKNNDVGSAAFLEKINAQVDRLTDLINDLLDVTKVQLGKMQFHERRFNMEDLIKEKVEELQLTTEKHTIQYIGRLKVSVCADWERTGQVLTNLLSNAIKYSPHGGDIIVDAWEKQDKIIVSVQDFGLGIPKEKQSRIFERFYRVDESRAREDKTVPGLGLGLYITAEIIKRQGGEIWLESEKGKGTTFYFSLPVECVVLQQQQDTIALEAEKHA